MAQRGERTDVEHLQLVAVADDLWSLSLPHRFMGLDFGARMSVVRLPAGGLVVHSPLPLTETLRQQLQHLGPVVDVVCPCMFHHLYADAWIAAYPTAKLHGPHGLPGKRKDLKFDHMLGHGQVPDHWEGVLEFLPLRGSMLEETALLHHPSKTLLTADLIQNFVPPGDERGTPNDPTQPLAMEQNLLTRCYCRLTGLYGGPGVSRVVRWAIRDRPAFRVSLDAILRSGFDRVLMGHGAMISTGGPEALRQAYAWLS